MKKFIILIALAGLALSPAASDVRLFAQDDSDSMSDGNDGNGNDANGDVSKPSESEDDQNDVDADGETVDESDLNEVDPWLLETDPGNNKPQK